MTSRVPFYFLLPGTAALTCRMDFPCKTLGYKLFKLDAIGDLITYPRQAHAKCVNDTPSSIGKQKAVIGDTQRIFRFFQWNYWTP